MVVTQKFLKYQHETNLEPIVFTFFAVRATKPSGAVTVCC